MSYDLLCPTQKLSLVFITTFFATHHPTISPSPSPFSSPYKHLSLLQYLRKGCTQYFCGRDTEKSLPADRKSSSHQKKGPLKDPILDDMRDFTTVDKALTNFGLSDNERLAVYTTVAAVLHLGNISFEDNPDDTKGT